MRQDQLSGNDKFGDYKAIELAIGWPSAVKTLLEAGTVSIWQNTLINAAELGCISSLKLLLEAGIAVTRLNVEWIATSAKEWGNGPPR